MEFKHQLTVFVLVANHKLKLELKLRMFEFKL